MCTDLIRNHGRESWKEAGNDAETSTASVDVDTVDGYRG